MYITIQDRRVVLTEAQYSAYIKRTQKKNEFYKTSFEWKGEPRHLPISGYCPRTKGEIDNISSWKQGKKESLNNEFSSFMKRELC